MAPMQATSQIAAASQYGSAESGVMAHAAAAG
jgi:hypothetical protein